MDLSSTKDELLRKIADYLVINASFTNSLGLFYGKMGIVIFFYHYARYLPNPDYNEFADELLDEIYEDIHADILVNFDEGLCGIAWGLQYLAQHNFVEGDISEVLKDIDRKIMERDPYRITDLSFQKGLKGILYYVLVRLSSKQNDDVLFDDIYLSALNSMMKKLDLNEENEIPGFSIEDSERILSGSVIDLSSLPLPKQLFVNLPEVGEDLSDLPLGIANGLSGIGLQLMLNNTVDEV